MTQNPQQDIFYRFLTKCRINFCALPLHIGRADAGLRDILGSTKNSLTGLKLTELKDRCLYLLSDSFKCRYMLARTREGVLCIGPYLPEAVSESFLLETAEKFSLPPLAAVMLRRYYASLPLLGDDSAVFVMVHTYLETLWGTSAYGVEEISAAVDRDPSVKAAEIADSAAQSRWAIENIEERYRYENMLMQTVQTGQTGRLQMLLRGFNTMSFEKRVTEEVRNMKNYCIIMNTLLRKAVEKGGVHPYHIDRISSNFASRIENLTTTKQVPQLVEEMFLTYCRSVHKYGGEGYSPPVQKAMLYIEASISGELSLKRLAQEININPSYLSDLFKKETGSTLTEHINRRRIDRACRLLKETALQVQTVAQYCGIQDVNYFSKVFKKYTGKTPSEYRKNG